METLPPGAHFEWARTFTEGDVTAFCGVTGDFNPFHINEEFAARERFGRRIVPGLLTGSMLTHIGGLLGFLAAEMSFTFKAPVHVGETVRCLVEILEVDERGLARARATMTVEDREVLVAHFAGRAHAVRLAR